MKIALNLDLTLSDDGKCPALLKSSGIIDLGAFCVELWPKQVSYRISVPISYISWLGIDVYPTDLLLYPAAGY